MGKLLTPVKGLYITDSTPESSTLSNTMACLTDGSLNVCANLSWTTAWALEFSSPVNISAYRIYFRALGGYTDYTGSWYSGYDVFSIYTSDDNSTWTLKQTYVNPAVTVADGNLAYTDLVLTTVVTARYIKAYCPKTWTVLTQTHGAREVQLCELQAYDDSAVIIPPAVEAYITGNPCGILPIKMSVAAMEISFHVPQAFVGNLPATAELFTSTHCPSVAMTHFPEFAEIVLSRSLPSYVWSIPARNRPAAQVIYTCTLTGDGESPAVPDLTLPMSSFQGRMRDGDPSYISAVIPNCMVYADDILARQNGDIVIKKGYRFQDGTTQLEEIARVDFESVRIDQGSKSASATISGHKTISSSSVKTITVEGVSYYCLQADGKRRVRALLDLFLRIGDTCVYGTGTSDYMTVGYITYTVSVNQTIMEVTEA